MVGVDRKDSLARAGSVHLALLLYPDGPVSKTLDVEAANAACSLVGNPDWRTDDCKTLGHVSAYCEGDVLVVTLAVEDFSTVVLCYDGGTLLLIDDHVRPYQSLVVSL